MEEQTAPGTHGLVLHWAARYDLLAWLLTHGRERELREAIIRLAELQAGNDVLDIGCGTGTLAIAATHNIGTTGSVTGIDASPAMIARAKRKAGKAGDLPRFRLPSPRICRFRIDDSTWCSAR
jgi:ubiquinone/menaquinone biosynthesis C-methylase UbiE